MPLRKRRSSYVNLRAPELLNPIILALDVDSAEECFRLAGLLRDRIGAFKIGPRLGVRYGADLIARLAKMAPVFVDNKYLDIPNTMEAAIRATFEAGASLATVHAWAGSEALERLAKVESELNQIRPFQILVVTILTSFNRETLPPGLQEVPVQNLVEDLARLSLDSGLLGLVCSPQEVEGLRALSQDAFLVTPGVRLPEDDRGDQKRIETPAEAIRRGASALVVGRPIVASKDPVAAVERILESVQEGQS